MSISHCVISSGDNVESSEWNDSKQADRMTAPEEEVASSAACRRVWRAVDAAVPCPAKTGTNSSEELTKAICSECGIREFDKSTGSL